jgi:hypothetical protein
VETRLINSQFLSRRDVRVWFWDGEREYKGQCAEWADNGMIFHVSMKYPGVRTMADASAALGGVKRLLEGKKVMVELSSSRVKGEVKFRFLKIAPVPGKSGIFLVEAVYETPPDPGFLKTLLEPVLVKRSKP